MSPALPPDLRARVLAAARAEPSPTRAQTRRRAAIALAAGAAAALLGVPVFGVETTLRPHALVVTTVVGWGLIALAYTLAALARGRAMLGLPRAALVTLAIAAAPLLFGWAVMWTHVFGASEITTGSPVHFRCFAATLLLAAGPFIAFAAVRRGTDPVHPIATGALLGAAAGAWGSVMIDLHCPVSTTAHIAFGHVLPALALAIAGAAIGARILGVRGR